LWQTGRAFHVYLALVLGEFDLKRSGDDPCIFVKVDPTSGKRIVVQVFVDDIMLTGDWSCEIALLVTHLRRVFPEVKLEELAKFVGMQIKRDRSKREVHVHLDQYAQQIVAEHVPAHVGGSATPLYSTVNYRDLAPDLGCCRQASLLRRLRVAGAESSHRPTGLRWEVPPDRTP
jgi:hypothetical protein